MAFWDTYENLCGERDISPQSKEIRDFIGASSATISDWKKKGIFPKVEYLIKISVFFDVTLDYLAGLSQVKKPVIDCDEREEVMLSAFRLSDEKGKAKITQIAMNEAERSESERKNAQGGASISNAG